MDMTITRDEFRLMANWVRDATGIVLETGKEYLIETRLSRLAAEAGCTTFSEFFFKLRADGTGPLARKTIDRITTQETSFFRDSATFEMFKYKILPDIVDRKRARHAYGPVTIRIWSAACSTGQEVYSIGMSIKEVLVDLDVYRVTILGTDISDSALAKASRGRYNRMEAERGLDPGQLSKHFIRTPEGEYAVSDELRAMATFRQFNLFNDFSPLGTWDVIFCRNVAIYFDEKDKKSLFDRIGTVLEHDGSMVIGSTETIQGLCPQYESQRYHRSVFYRLK
jgi:chemotaxis protein methyltransferase CheR